MHGNFRWFEAVDGRHAKIGQREPNRDERVLTICGHWTNATVWQGAPLPSCVACDAEFRRRSGMEPSIYLKFLTW
jgi:hypothetical protein